MTRFINVKYQLGILSLIMGGIIALWICHIWCRAPSPHTVSLPASAGGIKVVDMIPLDLSREENADSEPFLAVNPANPNVMAASSLTPNPFGSRSGLAPIFVSTDAGETWKVRNIVPTTLITADMTQALTSNGTIFAAALAHRNIRELTARLPVEYRGLTGTVAESETPLTVARKRFHVDQPWISRSAVRGNETLYIVSNDEAAESGHTATLEISSDSGVSFRTLRLERQRTALQDGPAVRIAAAKDGTLYAAYFGWRKRDGDLRNADVVITRDDNGGLAERAFEALTYEDGLPGMVIANTNIPFLPLEPVLGQERIGSTLSLAVDPNKSSQLYIVWGDRVGDGDIYTLHVRLSTDRGASWSRDLRTLRNATCPAISVNEDGVVALLYQQVIGEGADSKWVTHLEQTKNAFDSVTDSVLLRTSAMTPYWGNRLPYIGDYNYLLAVGREFRGVFSASNDPDSRNFPNGVNHVFQRRVDFTKRRLLNELGQGDVKISIDPYYFSVPSI